MQTCPFGREAGHERAIVAAAWAVDLGTTYRDGTVRYTVMCDACLPVVQRYQASQGVTITPHRIDAVLHKLPCKAAWRSHACDYPRDHPGGHECDCGDTPDDDDEVWEQTWLD